MDTELVGTDAQGRMVFCGVSPNGFSIFALVASAPIPANFVIANLLLDPPVAEPDEPVAITVQVTNEGGQAGTFGVLLQVDGQAVDTLEISLEAGQQGQVLFFLTQAEVGSYQVKVEDTTNTLEVARALSPAFVSYTGLSVSPAEVAPDEQATLTVQVANSGSQPGKLDMEVLLNGVLFEVRPTRIPGGVSLPVSFPITLDLPGQYEISVGGLTTTLTVARSLTPAAFSVSNLDIRPAEVSPGERSTIVVLVENTGQTDGTFDVVLLINGQEETRQSVSVEALTSIPVIFDVVKDDPGTYNVRIEGLNGTLTVLRVPTAVFSFSALQISPETLEAGEAVTITGSISNTGDAAGSRTVTLEINGAVEDTQDVTVAAGGSREVTFTVTRDQPGIYNVEIEGQMATFEVTAPAAGLSIGLIIGIIVGLIAVVVVVVYFFVLRKPSPGPSGASPAE